MLREFRVSWKAPTCVAFDAGGGAPLGLSRRKRREKGGVADVSTIYPHHEYC